MEAKQILIKCFETILVLVACFAPIAAQYDLSERGESPEKHLHLFHTGTINPFQDLRPLEAGEGIELKVQNRPLPNLFISRSILRNIGKAPILPDDFHEKLSIDLDEPWEIIAVKNGSKSNGYIHLKWNRIDLRRFEADPALLNPGDQVSTTVYLSNPSAGSLATIGDNETPKERWNVRITNLKQIGHGDGYIEKWAENFVGKWHGLVVFLTGRELIFTCVLALGNLAFVVYLLGSRGFFTPWGWKGVVYSLGATAVSASFAESVNTYLFGSITTNFWDSVYRSIGEPHSVDHWLNAPPIIVNATILLVLLNLKMVRARKRKQAAKD